MSKKLTPLWLGSIGLALLIAISLAIFLGSKYTQYQKVAQGPRSHSPGIIVTITSPGSGHYATAGDPQIVNVLASGPHPVIEVELWVDNDLIGVKESPTLVGVSPFAVSFIGLPFNPGAHMLLARAKDTNGGIKDSDIVWIFVAEDPNALAEVSYLPQPAASQLSPPLSGETIDDSTPWSPSIGGFIDWLSGSGDALKAPDLAAQVDGCAITLLIHDHSEDELGFSVFRTAEGQTQSPTPTFVLEPHAGLGWFAAQEMLTQGGTYTYIVETFNGQDKVAASNPALVNIDCPSQPSPPTAYSLILKKFKPAVAADNLYCYVSIDGIHWQRTPEVGFFSPGVLDALDPNQVGVEPSGIDQIEGGGGGNGSPADSFFDVMFEFNVPEPGTSEGSQIINLDCWGWLGSQLGSLGQFEVGVDTGQGGLINLNKPEFGTEITFELLPINYLESIFPPKPEYDPQLLAPTIHFSTADTDCVNHLPGWVKPDFEIQMCHPGEYVDILNPGDLSWHQHMYVFWDLDNKKNCGESGQCIDPSDQASLDQWGYIVSEAGYNLYDLGVSSLIPVKTFNSLRDVLYIVPEDGSCNDVRTFKIRTWVKLFGSEKIYESKGLGTVLSFVEPCWQIVTVVTDSVEGQLATQEVHEAVLATQEVLEAVLATPETP